MKLPPGRFHPPSNHATRLWLFRKVLKKMLCKYHANRKLRLACATIRRNCRHLLKADIVNKCGAASTTLVPSGEDPPPSPMVEKKKNERQPVGHSAPSWRKTLTRCGRCCSMNTRRLALGRDLQQSRMRRASCSMQTKLRQYTRSIGTIVSVVTYKQR